MKAVMKTRTEEGLELKDIKKPVIKSDELLVRIQMTGICGSDLHIYKYDEQAQRWKPPIPMIIGHEFSGEVIEVGKDVQGFEIGDRIAADSHIPCMNCYLCKTGRIHICENMLLYGIQIKQGSFAEYSGVPQSIAYKLPESLSFKEGALLEPFGVAMHAVERSGIFIGDTVVVLGCGPIGLFVQQIVKASGASLIVSSDISDFRLDFSEKIGVKYAVNPNNEDLSQKVMELTDGRGADIVFEVAGVPSTITKSFDLIGKNGKIILIGLYGKPVEVDTTGNITYKEGMAIGTTGRHMFQTWDRMVKMIGAGLVDLEKVVTHTLPLDEFEKGFQAIFKGEAVKVLVEPSSTS